jgi:iron complex transport system substrate-binding protein
MTTAATARWASRLRASKPVAAACLALALTAGPATAQAADPGRKPQRIVSLNMCVDELLLRLAEPPRIASVTWLSRDARNSNVAELAARVSVNHGLAEEVVPLDPDLVLTGAYTTRTAVAMLRQTSIPVKKFGIPSTVEGVRRQIGEMARLVGEASKGESLIAALDRDLASLPPAPAERPSAIVLNPNGATVGKGTLVDEIMSMAGLENIAARLGIDNYERVPLETLVATPVDVLIVSANRDGPPALATEILRHPVLARLAHRTRIVLIPGRLWNCGGPALAEAVARLRSVAVDVARARRTQ